MTRRLLCLSALLASAACATDLIGSTIPPYPDGLIDKYGACVARTSRGLAHECDYSVGILESSDGKRRVLFGARMAGRDNNRKAFWTITDAIPYPVLPDGYFLAIALCQDDGKNDEAIIAAVRDEKAEWLNELLWARRYDMSKERFVEHTTAGVRCRNEGWGL